MQRRDLFILATLIAALGVGLALRSFRGRVTQPPASDQKHSKWSAIATEPATTSSTTRPALPDFLDEGSHKLPDGRPVPLRLHRIGELALPTGRIVACDGIVVPLQRPPFTTTVAPGRYPVWLGIADMGKSGPRVAWAMIQFADRAPATWQMAQLPGQEPAKLGADEIFGYGVDAGTGCFMDASALPVARDVWGRQGREILKWWHEESDQGRQNDKWLNLALDQQTRANQILFSSGWGDGFYASYFGRDSSGLPVCLLTDFGILNLGPMLLPNGAKQ